MLPGGNSLSSDGGGIKSFQEQDAGEQHPGSNGGGGSFLSKLASLLCGGSSSFSSSAGKATKIKKQTDWRVVLTTVAMFVMFVIERGDDSVLPSLYAPVGAADAYEATNGSSDEGVAGGGATAPSGVP